VHVAEAVSEFFIGPLLIEYHVVGMVTVALDAPTAVMLDHCASPFPHVTLSR
jgi:hypothetical protein